MVGRTRDARIRCLASWCIQKNHNQSYGEEGSYGRKHDHDFLNPCGLASDCDRDRYNNLVRFRVSRKGERCATQGALFNITLYMYVVMATPERHDSPFEGIETHGTLGEVVTHY